MKLRQDKRPHYVVDAVNPLAADESRVPSMFAVIPYDRSVSMPPETIMATFKKQAVVILDCPIDRQWDFDLDSLQVLGDLDCKRSMQSQHNHLPKPNFNMLTWA